jgi:hypothetical protein
MTLVSGILEQPETREWKILKSQIEIQKSKRGDKPNGDRVGLLAWALAQTQALLHDHQLPL